MTVTIGTAFERPPTGTAAGSGPWLLLGRNLVRLLETLAAGLLAIGIVLAAAAWLIVVAPIQYVINLACGEPARPRGNRDVPWTSDAGQEGLKSAIPSSTRNPKERTPSG